MLDNICSLPLSSDLFAHAIHPTEPILSVGLSAGHVETFRLPAAESTGADGYRGANGHGSKSDLNARGRRLSENGFDMVDTIWRTRRHKGSCRTLAYSIDGEALYSAGTDGLLKVAATATGKVMAKVAIPQIEGPKTLISDSPSILNTLSPQTLLLGSDSGYIYVYDLRASAQSPSSRPSQSFQPHAQPEGPSSSESISSITALPPTSTSTSGTSKLWVSTSGSTLAATDLRKGIVAVSEDQGDVLLSSVCLPAALFTTNRPKGGGSDVAEHSMDKIVIGGMSGALTVWNRGRWADRMWSFTFSESKGPFGDDQEVEKLAVVPEEVILQPGISGHRIVAAGLSNGRVAFMKINAKGATQVGEVTHDDGTVDGLAALGFDVAGRMISGGGRLVKIWHQKSEEADESTEEVRRQVADGTAEAADDDNGGSDNDSDDDINDEKQKSRPRKRRKRKSQSKKHGNHGIMAFQAMD